MAKLGRPTFQPCRLHSWGVTHELAQKIDVGAIAAVGPELER